MYIASKVLGSKVDGLHGHAIWKVCLFYLNHHLVVLFSQHFLIHSARDTYTTYIMMFYWYCCHFYHAGMKIIGMLADTIYENCWGLQLRSKTEDGITSDRTRPDQAGNIISVTDITTPWRHLPAMICSVSIPTSSPYLYLSISHETSWEKLLVKRVIYNFERNQTV